MAPAGLEPTAVGYRWVCGSCPFVAEDVEEARAHMAETEERYRAGTGPYQHAVYEACEGDRDKGVERWIYGDPKTGELRIGLRVDYESRSAMYKRRKKRG